MSLSRDPYREEVDFAELALKYPDFNKHLKKNGQLDFSNPQAVKQLTYCLLKRDFNLKLDLPDDRLCPPVPNRLNYILWIQDLIDTTSDSYDDRYDSEREVIGLDIGTGSSCIYPLLGCSQRSKWRFAATEVDAKNLEFARKNVVANNLRSRIQPMPNRPDGPLIPLDGLGLRSIDFTMCNPPFYSTSKEMLESAKTKSRPPYSACTGADIEMVTPGGETEFVSRMIEESIVLKNRVQWYSTMLGKLSSLGVIIERLKKEGVNNWAVTEFVQGAKTKRWGVSWTWGGMRPSMAAARRGWSLPKNLLPFPAEFSFAVNDAAAEDVAAKIDATVRGLDLQWQFKPLLKAGVGLANKNVWSRSARRERQKQQPQTEADAMDEDENENVALGFRVNVEQDLRSKSSLVNVRWLQGSDHVLFESFCGLIKRLLS